jgi:hypothetical protein
MELKGSGETRYLETRYDGNSCTAGWDGRITIYESVGCKRGCRVSGRYKPLHMS